LVYCVEKNLATLEHFKRQACPEMNRRSGPLNLIYVRRMLPSLHADSIIFCQFINFMN
jgi:hypothetical protein